MRFKRYPLIWNKGLYYLGSPYSRYPEGIEAAFEHVSELAADLLKQGLDCYVPIAHSHAIAKFGRIDPLDHDIWLPLDKKMMERCDGLFVAMMDGWENSYGISVEIEEFTRMRKPIVYLEVVYDRFIATEKDIGRH
jgi:hypothetical protein